MIYATRKRTLDSRCRSSERSFRASSRKRSNAWLTHLGTGIRSIVKGIVGSAVAELFTSVVAECVFRLSLTSYHHVIKRTDYRRKEPRRHRMKMQTLEVGHMNAAKKQSSGPLRRGPIRRGAIRIGPNGSGSSWDGNQ